MGHLATPAFGFANTQVAFDRGVRPKIAINDEGVFVTTFSDRDNWMYYAVGTVDGVCVNLQKPKALQNPSSDDKAHRGYVPAVAMNNTMVVEMHVNDKDKNSLYCSVGSINGAAGSRTVSWSGTKQYDDGLMPALTNIDGNTLIEFHTSNGSGKIYYHVGNVSASGMKWAAGGSKVVNFANDIEGENVSAQFDGTRVVIAYENEGELNYAVGALQPSNTITWLSNAKYDEGHAPSIVLKDGLVYEFHEGKSQKLWQRVGRLTSSNTIDWLNWLGQTDDKSADQYSYEYDVQYVPAVAGTGNLMVQVCASGDEQLDADDYELYCSASRLIDRANWMGDNIAALGAKTLRDIAMPASHDAGMYTGTVAKVARTQNLDFLGQCLTGSRYFDIRPTLTRDQYYCYHGVDSVMLGATIDQMLTDLVEFLTEWSSQELVILKLSHYGNGMHPDLKNLVFRGLIYKIKTALGDWLVKPPASGQRLADVDVASLIGEKGGVLVVCDGLMSGALVKEGIDIYSYRDWQSPDPKQGDLTVFDIYSDTTDLTEMMTGSDAASAHGGPDISYLPNGQIPKWQGPGVSGAPAYDGFTGFCHGDKIVPCDLFLLSWTLTPVTDVWDYAQDANGALVDNIPSDPRNKLKRAINLIYVDYVSYARATDVACVRNGFVTGLSAEQPERSGLAAE